MIRCSACGIRVPEALPVCAQHGAVDVSSSSLEPPAGSDFDVHAAFEALGYRIEKPLGRGGYGIVYGASRIEDGTPVALKLAAGEHRDAAASLAREAEALRIVGAPHVPAMHLLRQVFETAPDYASARAALETTPLANAALFTLVGLAPGETCVIERTRLECAQRHYYRDE